MRRDLRVGVIGVGRRGWIARHAHRPGAGSRVVAVLDPDPSARARALAWFGDRLHVPADLDELLGRDLDAVFVLSPDHLHEDHAVAVLEAGVPAYLEKPMAISIAGCDRILRVAEATGTGLFVGHTMRFLPFVREMRRLIQEGAIGEPKAAWCRHFVGQGGELYFADWHADRRNTNGLLLQKGSHDIDVIQWLCGARAAVVTAIGDLLLYGDRRERERALVAAGAAAGVAPADQPYPGSGWRAPVSAEPVVDVEDTSMALMRLENGVLASYQQCHFTPDHWRNYTIIGTEGRIENVGDMGSGVELRVWRRRRSGGDAPADRRVPVSGGRWDADLGLVDEFLRHVREGCPSAIPPVAARDAVATACAATYSLRRGGQPVAVPAYDPRRLR